MGCRDCHMSLYQFAALSEDAGKLRQFLLDHHMLGRVCFCEECGHKCRIDWRRKMFCCNRQVTYRKHGEGEHTKIKESHLFAKSLVAGTWFSRSKLSQQIVRRFCCLWLTFVHPRTVRISREMSLS